MATADSFSARSALRVGGRAYEIVIARRARGLVRRLAPALRAADPAREPAPREDGARTRDVEALAPGTRRPSRARRSASCPRASCSRTSPACPPSWTSRRCATRCAPGRRPGEDQPAAPGRAGDRPLGAGGRVRDPARDRAQRRARVRAQPRALPVPALGPERVRATSRSCRRTPASCHQVNLEYLARVVEVRDGAGVPRHARRHRLAHDDDQRPGRARLGRRRDRGRGGDARPAGLDARAAGRRLQADAARCRRARRRPTSSSP